MYGLPQLLQRISSNTTTLWSKCSSFRYRNFATHLQSGVIGRYAVVLFLKHWTYNVPNVTDWTNITQDIWWIIVLMLGPSLLTGELCWKASYEVVRGDSIRELDRRSRTEEHSPSYSGTIYGKCFFNSLITSMLKCFQIKTFSLELYCARVYEDNT